MLQDNIALHGTTQILAFISRIKTVPACQYVSYHGPLIGASGGFSPINPCQLPLLFHHGPIYGVSGALARGSSNVYTPCHNLSVVFFIILHNDQWEPNEPSK